MSTNAYNQIISQFGDLTSKEQDQLIFELANAVALRGDSAPRRSILELRGLGKEVWHGIDAGEYLREERASWHG
jgi:hypothetical protein